MNHGPSLSRCEDFVYFLSTLALLLAIFLIVWYSMRAIFFRNDLLKYRKEALIALFMLLENAKIQQAGVWTVSREDMSKFEYGWVLEHFLDGRQNWRTFIERCVEDPRKFAEEHAKTKDGTHRQMGQEVKTGPD